MCVGKQEKVKGWMLLSLELWVVPRGLHGTVVAGFVNLALNVLLNRLWQRIHVTQVLSECVFGSVDSDL